MAEDSAAIRAALLDALQSGRVDLPALGDRLARTLREPGGRREPGEQRQFLNGLETLLVEGLRDEGRPTRDLVFDTAIPGLVAEGRTALELVEGHTTLFVALGHELAAAVPPELSAGAATWLAAWSGDYVREVTERALAAERAGSGG
jgi:hypothetical protein